MLGFISLISENFNRLFNITHIYKCMAYVDGGNDKDKVVDAFEIKEFSLRRAYKTAYDVLQLKYPNKGLDVRIFKQKI